MDRVCRLLIMGRACGSIYFIFMSQMVGSVLFINKLDVQKQQRVRGATWDEETQPGSENPDKFCFYSRN